MVEIKTWCCGVVIWSGSTLRTAIEGAAAHGVSLKYADLRNMYLAYMYIPGIDISRANLSGADFSESVLSGSDLSYAMVRGACFEDADLTQAIAIETDFGRASMDGADTTGIVTEDPVW